jgi:hypothetical protein
MNPAIMTLHQFKLLSEDEQAGAIWQYGVLLDTRLQDVYDVLLYTIDCFYVEVYYDLEQNKIDCFESFSSLDGLDLYIQKLDISLLLKL